jgi:hypothetical protein
MFQRNKRVSARLSNSSLSKVMDGGVWEYVIKEVHENEEELHCSGTQRRLVRAADGGLFSDGINAIEEKNRTSVRCQ